MNINRINQASGIEISAPHNQNETPKDNKFQGEMSSDALNLGDTVGRSMLIKGFSPEEKLQKLVGLMQELKVDLGGEKMSLLNSLEYSDYSVIDVKDRAKSGKLDGMLSFLETLKNTTLDTEGNGERKPITDIIPGNILILQLLMGVDDYKPVNAIFEELNNLGEFKGFNNVDLLNILMHYNPEKSTPESYVDTYYYFKTAEDENGEKIYQSSSIERNSDSFEYMMNNVAGTEQEQVFEKLIQLVDGGVLDKHIFSYLPASGVLNSYVSEDVEKLYDAYKNDVAPMDTFVPVVKDDADIKMGDVYQFEGEKNIRIKTADGKSEPVELTREMYFKLFPPVERFSTTQNKIGNCWELTGFNDMYSDEVSRPDLLKAFHQRGNDVYIKFPNGQASEIKFDNGELPETANSDYYSKGAKGIQLLEYADGYEQQMRKVDEELDFLRENIEDTDNDAKKIEYQTVLDKTEQVIKENDYNVSFDCAVQDGTKTGMCVKYDGKYDNAFTQARKGGRTQFIYSLFGYESAQRFSTLGAKKDILSNPKTFEKYKISFDSKGYGVEEDISPDKGLVSTHAYRIKPAQIGDNGKVETFKLINPWGVLETEITLEEALKYSTAINVAKRP